MSSSIIRYIAIGTTFWTIS